MEKTRQHANLMHLKKQDIEDATLQSGHRKRLKDRFMKSPIRSLPDYEILEMLLFSVFQRKDTKVIAKKLLSKFGSFVELINADSSEIKTIVGAGEGLAFQIKLLADLFSRLHIPTDKPVSILNNWMSVLHYCNFSMGFSKIEQFRVLYLNKNNCLIADELHDHGTVDRIQIYPREIAKRALEQSASAIILVHNHPSGSIEPSSEDIEMTKQVIKALSVLSISVHDHLIIAKNKHFSFKASGLI